MMPVADVNRKSQMNIFKKLSICLMTYFVISMVTIPFINLIWIGDGAILAGIQFPKIIPANSIRYYYSAGLAEKLNISKGSFSPDYGFSRPYALIIVYAFPLLALVLYYALFIKNRKGNGKYILVLLFLSVLDYFCTLYFSHTPSLTIY
jgi:hypothetical protein